MTRKNEIAIPMIDDDCEGTEPKKIISDLNHTTALLSNLLSAITLLALNVNAGEAASVSEIAKCYLDKIVDLIGELEVGLRKGVSAND